MQNFWSREWHELRKHGLVWLLLFSFVAAAFVMADQARTVEQQRDLIHVLQIDSQQLFSARLQGLAEQHRNPGRRKKNRKNLRGQPLRLQSQSRPRASSRPKPQRRPTLRPEKASSRIRSGTHGALDLDLECSGLGANKSRLCRFAAHGRRDCAK